MFFFFSKVATERPLALVQIGLAVAALEVLGASIQKYTEPGKQIAILFVVRIIPTSMVYRVEVQ